jgi:hypothetical protein
MKAVTALLVSYIILTSFSGCKRTPENDAVWNRDNLGAIVELEPTELDLTPTPREKNKLAIPEVESEEEHWCSA